jgi:DNA-binding NarL/FixJ family response regulator
VDEAFHLGAPGYILKLDAEKEILLGIDAVLRGKKFISSSLNGPGFPQSTDT